MSHNRRVSDETLIDSYRQHQSVQKVAVEVGLCHQSVHERLSRLGMMRHVNVFTEAEREILKAEYVFYKKAGKVADLAARLGRTVQFLSRQARELGLTSYSYERPFLSVWKYMSEEAASVIWDDFKGFRGTLATFLRVRGYADSGFRETMRRFFPDEWEHVIELKAPKTTRYRRGRSFEYSVRDRLKRVGYFIMRSPASRSPIDLVAVKSGVVLFIQCKINGALQPKEWNEVYDLATSVGSIPILAVRDGLRDAKYYRLIARKTGERARQPFEEFHP